MNNRNKTDNTKKRLGAALLSAAFLAAMLGACGGQQPSSAAPPAESKPVSSSSLPVSQLPEEQLELSVLTGLPLENQQAAGQRISAVMVNNIPAARPCRGISQAQMLVEAEAEGGITRLMAMFDDYKNMPEVGSVRSGRPQFFELALPFQPLYVNDGSNVFLNEMLDYLQYRPWNIDSNARGVFFRDEKRLQQGFAMEHTSYTSGERLATFIEETGLDASRRYNSGYFNYLPYNQPPRSLADGSAERVEIVFSASGGYASYFTYDEAAGLYSMSQHNTRTASEEPTIDEGNNQQLQFTNVIVIFATMTPRDPANAGSGKVVNFGNGVGFYFSGGRYEWIRWQKGGPQEALRLISNDGLETPITVNPGTNYLALVDVNMAVNLGFGPVGAVQTLG